MADQCEKCKSYSTFKRLIKGAYVNICRDCKTPAKRKAPKKPAAKKASK